MVGRRPLNEGKSWTTTLRLWEIEEHNSHTNEEGFQWGADLSTGGKGQLGEQEGSWCQGVKQSVLCSFANENKGSF